MTHPDPAIDAIASVLYRAHHDAMALGGEPEYDLAAMAQPAIDGWHAVARAAIDLGARPDASLRSRFSEMLSPESTNVLGTGLSMREFMQLHSAEKLAASWTLQSQEEKKRRLVAVMRLSIELEHVRETMQFATRLAEMAIESVIEGDWKMVEEWVEHFSFGDERDEVRISAGKAYATFRELLLQAVRSGKEAAA